MNAKISRREALGVSIAAGVALAGGKATAQLTASQPMTRDGKVRDSNDPIRVAFLLDEQATVIDFAGPWEVFQDAGFDLFTVAPTTASLRASAGLHVVPDYALNEAPPAEIIVIPAQGGGRNPDQYNGHLKAAWLRARHPQTALLMSVCTGAFLLARTGLLDGLSATTHHDFYDDFAQAFPNVKLMRNTRFVEHENVMTAGGLSSGIDGALRVVKRFKSDSEALRVAEYMEYKSRDWRI